MNDNYLHVPNRIVHMVRLVIRVMITVNLFLLKFLYRYVVQQQLN